MGGLATKSVGTRRYDSSEFYELAGLLVPRVSRLFGTDAELTKSYRKKPSFGDMDILVKTGKGLGLGQSVRELIMDEFNPKIIVDNIPITLEKQANSGVYSFDHQDLQVDIILTPEDNWETSKVFFAYNDLGNLMGKIFHKFNLKYGFDGVKYVCRVNDDRVLGKVTVTKDMRRAFEFLGLSWERFQLGFDEITDVFDYVVSSPYFDPAAFRLENLNSINRKRNKRRQVYGEFVKYVENMPVRFEFDRDKDVYLQKIHDAFPEVDLLGRIDELRSLEATRRANREKFNGDIVMREYPWLKGELLGQVLHKFGLAVGGLDEFLKTASRESAWSEFEKFMAENETFLQHSNI